MSACLPSGTTRVTHTPPTHRPTMLPRPNRTAPGGNPPSFGGGTPTQKVRAGGWVRQRPRTTRASGCAPHATPAHAWEHAPLTGTRGYTPTTAVRGRCDRRCGRSRGRHAPGAPHGFRDRMAFLRGRCRAVNALLERRKLGTTGPFSPRSATTATGFADGPPPLPPLPLSLQESASRAAEGRAPFTRLAQAFLVDFARSGARCGRPPDLSRRLQQTLQPDEVVGATRRASARAGRRAG